METPIRWDMAGVPVPSVMSWDVTDPLTISVVFDTSGGFGDPVPVKWEMSRDLLYDAVTDPGFFPHGIGDVLAANMRGTFFLALKSPFGAAKFGSPSQPLQLFLEATYQVSPRGEEVVFTDSALERFMAND
jgi:hypothetical protein